MSSSTQTPPVWVRRSPRLRLCSMLDFEYDISQNTFLPRELRGLSKLFNCCWTFNIAMSALKISLPMDPPGDSQRTQQQKLSSHLSARPASLSLVLCKPDSWVQPHLTPGLGEGTEVTYGLLCIVGYGVQLIAIGSSPTVLDCWSGKVAL